MFRNRLIQFLLLPFTVLYGLGITIRNGLYTGGLLKSAKFNIPVIGVGNLTLGGAGKTPHVEFLIRLLASHLQIATLSRGYKRKSRGFRIVQRHDSSLTVGDEPFQYFLKYKEAIVAVSESRSVGIPMLLSKRPDIQGILLDDSYQHRSVTPSLNILLTEYRYPYSEDILLPSGRLREWRSAADRADIVIVSKCPDELQQEAVGEFRARLNLQDRQQLYFSRYAYGHPYPLLGGPPMRLDQLKEAVLISAIAQSDYMTDYVVSQVDKVYPMAFEDHHYFSPHEMSLLKIQYEQLSSDAAVILTTEKDATRLILHREYLIAQKLPIYILPVRVDIMLGQGPIFEQTIKNHLLSFKV